MKPRPTISAFVVATRPKSTLQCRRSIHTRATAPSQLWNNDTRRGGYTAGTWTLQSQYYASTSTQPSPKSTYGRADAPPPPRPPKSTTTHTRPPQIPASKAKEKLNPPDFTYAPALNVPARAEKQSFISHLWKCGRAYLSFYKSGVANTRQTAKLARSLRAKAGPTGTVDDAAQLTRAEWQVVRRSRKDMLRLPAFGVIFLVFGEWTPLLVKFLTPIIPEPCRVPGQVEADLRKREARRMDRQNKGVERMTRLSKREDVPAQVKPVGSGSEGLRHKNFETDEHFMLYVESTRYDCHGRVWDLINVTPPRWLLRRNLARTVEYLKKDDELIIRDGGWQALGDREVRRACVERGIYVLGKTDEECRRFLGEWFGAKK
ncbi:hypothetical protein HBI88_214700 [Parastagonospora nodorum]|nr:hypothetical protein HBI93_228980 [Parastagonospora nodorum]KAH5848992.1 hypothetical protein HBI90_226550 [Parastagonospora nodorum]KAH5859791.1 hypothetical protein HBI92_211800 [Parastagonospora nodorum]KAH5892343.1 hypothetical protein HBI89_215270 [Parastagonospora nodorum]KAH5902284.1 hypothetical protein HBI88_214700 [Parastagonospora nodorum]